jgi:kinesin family protein 3/17
VYSFLEIYNEEIRDLLGNDPKLKCELKEDPSRGVFVKDLTDVVVQDEATLNRVMDKGIQNRTTGATLMNQVKMPGREGGRAREKGIRRVFHPRALVA